MTTMLELFSFYQEAFCEKCLALNNTIQTKTNVLDNMIKLGETDSVSTLDDMKATLESHEVQLNLLNQPPLLAPPA